MIVEQTSLYFISTNPIPSYQDLFIEEDTRRVKYGDGETPWNSLEYSGLLQVENALIVDNSTEKSITAFAGGGQVSATILNAKYNIVETVVTTGDSVKCEPAIKNLEKTIANISLNDMELFPAVGDRFQLSGVLMAIDAPLTIATSNSVKLVSYENGIWIIL